MNRGFVLGTIRGGLVDLDGFVLKSTKRLLLLGVLVDWERRVRISVWISRVGRWCFYKKAIPIYVHKSEAIYGRCFICIVPQPNHVVSGYLFKMSM